MDHSERLDTALPGGAARRARPASPTGSTTIRSMPTCRSSLVCTVHQERRARCSFDWTGSAPPGARRHQQHLASYTAGRQRSQRRNPILSINMPNNDGVFRCHRRDRTAPARITNARAARRLRRPGPDRLSAPPIAHSAPWHNSIRIWSSPRPTAATPASPSAARTRQTPKPYIYVDFLSGAWGGRPCGGWAGRQHQHVRQHGELFSIEVIEAENPLEVLEYANGAGHRQVPGRFRGGAQPCGAPGGCWPRRACSRCAPTG